jgi:peptide/nickel transport system substrate-binding protein
MVVYMAWRPNADVYLTRFYHSDSIVVTGAKPDTNFSHYDQIDDLIEAARVETDADKQVQMWKDAQVQLLEDCVTYSLVSANQSYARRSWVDYGHELKSSLALYPQITEKTQILPHPSAEHEVFEFVVSTSVVSKMMGFLSRNPRSQTARENRC